MEGLGDNGKLKIKDLGASRKDLLERLKTD